MLLYLTALSLPKPGTFIALHRHKSEVRMRWTEADRVNYLDFLARVEQLYRKGPAGLNLPRPLLDAVYDSELTASMATNRILPYYLACSKGSLDRSFLISPERHDIEMIRLAGTEDEPNGLRFVVIGRNCDQLKLKPQIIAAAGSAPGDTLESRSNHALVKAVSEAQDEPACEGCAKIVAVPAEANVTLARDKRGEFVREVARIWA